MKKIIGLCGSYLEPLVIISSLIITLISLSQFNLFFLYWISFSLLLGIVLWRLRQPDLYCSIIKDKAFLAFSLFILWAILSTLLWSQVKVNSTVTLFYFLFGLLSYFIGYTDNRNKSLNIQKLLLALGIGLVFYTYYQFFELGISRPKGLFLNWNTHAAFLGMLLMPWVLRLALNPKINLLQILFISIICLLFSFAMGLTQSRGALFVIAVSFLCLFIIISKHRLPYKLSIFLFLLIIVGYIYSGLFVDETIFQRINSVTEAHTYTTTGSGRHLLWLPAWQMYMDRPFTGWGLDSYSSLFLQYKAPLTNEAGQFVHNDYLQFLLELGPVGLLLFLIFVFFIARKLYIVLQSKDNGIHPNKIESLILLAPCLGMLVHTFFTFHLYQIPIQILFCYYLGSAAKYFIIEQRMQVGDITTIKNKNFFWFYYAVWLLMIPFIFITGYTSYYIDKATKTKNFQEKKQLFKKASLLFPAYDKYDAMSAHLYTMQLLKLPDNATNKKQRNIIATNALEAVNSAIQKMPLFKLNYLNKAKIFHSMHHNYTEVSALYIKTLEIDPYNLDVRIQLAKLLDHNAQYQQALNVLWDGWERSYYGYYPAAAYYLQLQQHLNIKYGKPDDNLIIEQQIKEIQYLMKSKKTGKYIFHKSR